LLGLANVAVPALGAELVQLTTGPGNDTEAAWSPDGRSFAYGTISGFRDNWRIVLARVDSPADGYVLTEAQGCFYGPRWSPVGTVLACTGCRLAA